MLKNTSDSLVARRSFLTRLGAGVTVLGSGLAAGTSVANAQSAAAGAARPARHAQDDWMDKLPGKHRLVFDTTTPAGFGVAVAYANNFLTADKDGYGLTDQDHGIIIVARHFATPFAYNDAMWAKYAKAMPPFVVIDDPKTKQRPTINLFNVGTYGLDLPNLGTTIPDVVKRGVHFAVCQMATRFFAGPLAQATGGTQDAVYNELVANLVGNSHMVAAGIVAVNRAQERGYTMATAV
jgi:intracellular sulfur oxidation DsrE/DsrF family protein